MNKPFVYGIAVKDDNFTDRKKETRQLMMNFENGMNTIIISPRRIGKTSLVNKVSSCITDESIKIIHMDVYDCRSEYDFLNRFASAIMKSTAGHIDRVASTVKEFLTRVVPTFHFSPEPFTDFSISLGITPENYTPEEILNLPEVIARKQGKHLIICIDEFQQIGDFPDSINVQKRMRGAWQHHQHASYCMYGSKKHMMMNIFQNQRMPFYKFGQTIYLDKIPKEDWCQYIKSRFESKNKRISDAFAERICNDVECYSTYVQELAWTIYVETEEEVTEDNYHEGLQMLLRQNAAYFQNQIATLTTYQMNLIRALCDGVNSDFGSKKIIDKYKLGTKSNINRLKNALEDKELIETSNGITTLCDPVFRIWFRQEYMM